MRSTSSGDDGTLRDAGGGSPLSGGGLGRMRPSAGTAIAEAAPSVSATACCVGDGGGGEAGLSAIKSGTAPACGVLTRSANAGVWRNGPTMDQCFGSALAHRANRIWRSMASSSAPNASLDECLALEVENAACVQRKTVRAAYAMSSLPKVFLTTAASAATACGAATVAMSFALGLLVLSFTSLVYLLFPPTLSSKATISLYASF